jgi:predicted RNA-binding Zn ribbon-like protein
VGEIGHGAAQGGDRGEVGAFLFVGGALALDLVNTEVVVRGRRRDLLAGPQDVERWWQAARRHHPQTVEVPGQPVYEPALLSKLKELRTGLRAIFSAVVEGALPQTADIDLLNAVLSTGHHAVQGAPDGRLRPVYRTADASEAAVLLPIALSALHLLTAADTRRLHRCDNERCILLLYDTTKSATRRWCSVGCKDRARKLKHYRQVQAGRPGAHAQEGAS